jgi:hypothetical protein
MASVKIQFDDLVAKGINGAADYSVSKISDWVLTKDQLTDSNVTRELFLPDGTIIKLIISSLELLSLIQSAETDLTYNNVVYTTIYSAIENPPSYLIVERALPVTGYDPSVKPNITGVLGISY